MKQAKYQIGDRFVIREHLIFGGFCTHCGQKYYYLPFAGNMLDLYFCSTCQEIPEYD